jgi:hypothetical protein
VFWGGSQATPRRPQDLILAEQWFQNSLSAKSSCCHLGIGGNAGRHRQIKSHCNVLRRVEDDGIHVAVGVDLNGPDPVY